jgi:hypothetical protein
LCSHLIEGKTQIANNENKDVVDFTSWQGSLLVHPFRKERWLGTLTIGDIIWRYQYPDPLPDPY